MFVKDQMNNGKRSLKMVFGHLLGVEADDAYVTVRELTVGEGLGWRKLNDKDEEARFDYVWKLLPSLILEHNFYKTEEKVMGNEEVADFLHDKFSTFCLVVQELAAFNFFIQPPRK